MKFPRLRTAGTAESTELTAVEETSTTEEAGGGRASTPKKGAPTPKRRDAEGRRRGPVPPPPRTQREAMKRSKAQRGTKADRQTASAYRRERIAAGDEKYMLPRDKGPVRGYVRDLVDSRRHLVGLFMPLAVLLLLSMFLQVAAIQLYVFTFTLLFLLIMITEGLLIGRRVVMAVRVRFPDAPDRSFGLGFYAFQRATTIRKLRMPKPQARAGQAV